MHALISVLCVLRAVILDALPYDNHTSVACISAGYLDSNAAISIKLPSIDDAWQYAATPLMILF